MSVLIDKSADIVNANRCWRSPVYNWGHLNRQTNREVSETSRPLLANFATFDVRKSWNDRNFHRRCDLITNKQTMKLPSLIATILAYAHTDIHIILHIHFDTYNISPRYFPYERLQKHRCSFSFHICWFGWASAIAIDAISVVFGAEDEWQLMEKQPCFSWASCALCGFGVATATSKSASESAQELNATNVRR